jgi:hypothetical protein
MRGTMRSAFSAPIEATNVPASRTVLLARETC